jgi:hypothetical protein
VASKSPFHVHHLCKIPLIVSLHGWLTDFFIVRALLGLPADLLLTDGSPIPLLRKAYTRAHVCVPGWALRRPCSTPRVMRTAPFMNWVSGRGAARPCYLCRLLCCVHLRVPRNMCCGSVRRCAHGLRFLRASLALVHSAHELMIQSGDPVMSACTTSRPKKIVRRRADKQLDDQSATLHSV